jgi:hypothetical protein
MSNGWTMTGDSQKNKIIITLSKENEHPVTFDQMKTSLVWNWSHKMPPLQCTS